MSVRDIPRAELSAEMPEWLPAVLARLLKSQIGPVLYGLALVLAATVVMLVLGELVALDHVGIGYVIPVMIAATRWGIFPAILTAIACVGASAFFFYPPIYSFRVSSPQELMDLVMFVIVAIVTGKLATSLREHLDAGRRREEEIKALYAMSKRLAAIPTEREIYAVIQEHLSTTTGCHVSLFEAGVEFSRLQELARKDRIPANVSAAMFAILEGRAEVPAGPVNGDANEGSWIIRTLSQRRSVLGVVGIKLPQAQGTNAELMRQRIDETFAEAAATLERIDVANAINEAKLRSQADQLRDALIGSVSHELRTPLASIIGPASILIEAPAVAQDSRLLAMACLVRDEAERLNGDIQNLLDASRISSSGVRPQLAWTDAADVINAAFDRRRARLASHRLDIEMGNDLPLIQADPILIEQALGQIIDNAVKYSPQDSRIVISAREQDGRLIIDVTDQGMGLSDDERERMCERFYRSPRLEAQIRGSGLGLWIAKAFIAASGGRLEAESEGPDRGTRVVISFPVADQTLLMPAGAADE
jgi:two-component system sensor histidine kinase KdpD